MFRSARFTFSVLLLFCLAAPLFGQYALRSVYTANASLWPSRTIHGKYLASRISAREIKFTGDYSNSVLVTTGFDVGKPLHIGLRGNTHSDRFFTDHYWQVWLGWRTSRSLTLALSGDLAGYAYSPGDARIGDPNDPIAGSSQSRFAPSLSVGANFAPTDDLSISAVASNLLRPNMAISEGIESRRPIAVSAGLAWSFGDVVPFADGDFLIDDGAEIEYRGGIVLNLLRNRLSLLGAGGSEGFDVGAEYDFGDIVVGYEFGMPAGDASNIYGNSHSASIELRAFAPKHIEPELPDTSNQICPSTPMTARWAIIRKDAGSLRYDFTLKSQPLDSAIFYFSPGRRASMDGNRGGDLWHIETAEFPGPNSWVAGFRNGEGFCLKRIYNNPAEASRMTIPMEEYIAVVPFDMTSKIVDTIAAYSEQNIPFYLDSSNPRHWQSYLDWLNVDRFLFAAPDYSPEPPEIRLASEFVVEKIDNRLHAEVAVAVGRIPHRLLATSPWAGDCAVFSDNPHDTLTFIVPNQIPDSIPIVVTGSATDAWMRVHKIGPDTLDNEIIAKVWDNTDYSLFNFVYFAKNDDICKGDFDPELDRLVERTIETDGKLLITGYRYRDAICAYDHARLRLPASQVRIDPALIPASVLFEDKWASPDSIWFINNFSQAIVMWEDVELPDEMAGYIVFADNKPIRLAATYDEIAHLQLNREPITGNLFIVSDLTPDVPVYVRIAPITGDGSFGMLSRQLEIRTKARRKTTVYEFSSKLGNPSAFDFSDYREVSMLSSNADIIDLYLGTDTPDDGYGNLELKSPSIVGSGRDVWKSRRAGILMMDVLPLSAPYDVQEITSIDKKQSEPCRIGSRYLVRTPDGYELVIRVESIDGEFPDRRIEIQYIYRLVETAPVLNWDR